MATKKRTTYLLTFSDGEQQEFARKDTAIRTGEKSGSPFRVETSSGKVVHDTLSVPETDEEPTEEPTAPAAEPTPEEASSRRSKPVDIEKMKEKIRMLLAKAESTTFPEERDTFNAAAEKMMLRLGLTVAELEASGKQESEEIVEVSRVYPGNYSIVMVPFAADVAAGYGDVTVLTRNVPDSLERVVYLIGFASDVEMVSTLLDSLDLQVMSALRVWQKENIEWRRRQTDMEKYLSHRSFIAGFGAEVKQRLASLREEVVAEASHGAELVLASKGDRVRDWVSDNIRVSENRGRGFSMDAVGYLAGRAAGEDADLSQKKVSSK